MALVNCAECGQPVSTDAAACPKCGKPRAPAARATKALSGCLGPILLGLVAIIVVANMSVDSKPPPPSPPVFDQSPEHQAKRKAAIQQAIGAGWFGKVTDASGRPEVWVTPGFVELAFDVKRAALAGVYGYYFDGSVPYRRLFLIDNQTGRPVGEFSLKWGLKLASDKR